jgi:hypothetical protein
LVGFIDLLENMAILLSLFNVDLNGDGDRADDDNDDAVEGACGRVLSDRGTRNL